MFLKSFRLVLLLLALGDVVLTACIPRSSSSVQVPAVVPEDASCEIDPDFLGLAFEQASFTRYAEDDEGNINDFSTNLMDSVYSRTGGKPNIRLGGTSPDYGRYLPGQAEPALPVAEQDNYQNIGGTTIGPSYWSYTKNFPNAVYIIQVPLATTNISEPIAWTQSALDSISEDQIFSIQPGNEPDLYADGFTGANGIPLQPPEYHGTLTSETYVGNWTRYAAAIKDAVSAVPKGRVFSAFDLAAANSFPVDVCFGLGIDDAGIIKEVAGHYYQGQAGTAATLGSVLMNLTLTHGNLDKFRGRIDWLRTNKPAIGFVLSEVGNSLQPKNTYEFQARLGSALWQVDYYLYSMTIGVKRINYQQIMHAGYNLWLPVASAGFPAQVFSNYYSQPFLADFIVSHSSLGASGKTRVSQLSVGAANIAAYVAYEDSAPKRIAAINMNYWNQTSSTETRGSVTLGFQVPDDVVEVTVYHLNSPAGAGAAADSITYGGSQWTYESLGKEVKDVRQDTTTVAVKDGVASVVVASSEAVLIWL
ncbi:hypothetical protein F5B22DRAFT_648126 [Xylaria bambusicola]|uniref:uncharacterized protein n=1 Tax=Xylaria bambusicola TaxID=326684 RepID=UPI002008AC5E|nr:uncharacterized protein F5B22DRAFT_648126 [Xylaria bambusicola]KAI0513032.1 hypothetical protein F5B22DRAFT_648126 [Xylaria bambusicola]